MLIILRKQVQILTDQNCPKSTKNEMSFDFIAKDQLTASMSLFRPMPNERGSHNGKIVSRFM